MLKYLLSKMELIKQLEPKCPILDDELSDVEVLETGTPEFNTALLNTNKMHVINIEIGLQRILYILLIIYS
ncbi:hypothetical protein AN1V17_21270 [Vallitalea sediminicola]